MKKFTLHAEVTVCCWTTVEAETIEQAIEIAEQRQVDIARGWDSTDESLEQWIIEDGDGEPCNIHAQ